MQYTPKVILRLDTETDLRRLTNLLNAWWERRDLRRAGRENGFSRREALGLLRWCGCTPDLRRKCRAELANPKRRLNSVFAERARAMLSHWYVDRLTPRQRAALLWQAQGWTLTAIARRMGTTAQGVNGFICAARERINKAELALASCANKPSRPVPDEAPTKLDSDVCIVSYGSSESRLDHDGPR